jgi:hypothetical protein
MTPERLKVFQKHLDVDEVKARMIWRLLETTKFNIEMTERGKLKIRDATQARDDLKVISNAARKLAILLRVEPLTKLLLEKEELGPIESLMEKKFSDEEISEYNSAPDRFCKQLDKIAMFAEAFSNSDENFRYMHWLPQANRSNENVYSMHLWPELFHYWELVGKSLAYTPSGPLHRFVKFVHDEMGYPVPAASTLRDAIKRYNGRSAKKDDAPLFELSSICVNSLPAP